MAINLPGPRNVFLPPVPDAIQDKALRDYLIELKRSMEAQLPRQFENAYAIVSTGTSGTFKSSAGDTITISSGIVTGIS